MEPALGRRMLCIAWGGALVGVAKSIAWPYAPRWLTTALYLALGWVDATTWRELGAGMGWRGVALFLGGGVVYSTGAVIYALRRPTRRRRSSATTRCSTSS